MLNSLANHGYLPRDGKDISLARFVTAFKESINLAPGPTLLFSTAGLPASTTGNFLTLHLDDLNKHGGKQRIFAIGNIVFMRYLSAITSRS